jgi:hypothetical protein
VGLVKLRLRSSPWALSLLAFLLVFLIAGEAGRAAPWPRPKSTATRPKPHKPPTVKKTPPPPPPAVVTENAQPGTADWLGPLATGRAAEVYASATDAMPGDSVALHVSTAQGASYRVLVYRLGWYGGLGAREVACLPSCGGAEVGVQQPINTIGDMHAGWPTTDTLTVDPTWVTGYYLIRVLLLDGPQPGKSATTYLVVNSPSPNSSMLIEVPVNTWEAYNSWGGRSTYDLAGLGRRADHVSFDRPFDWAGPGGQGPLGWELPFVRFVERSGYDVSYQSDEYTDAHPESLLGHRLVAVAGHSEYWTKTMRDAFETARDSGVNLAFMGANDAYWQIRYEDAGRTLVTYKSMSDPNPVVVEKTAMFREVGRLECALIGIQHQGASPLYWKAGDYTVPAAVLADPWMRNTGFLAGEVIPGIVSVESDTIPGDQSAASSCGHALTVFFHRENGGDKDGNADATRYTAPSGAVVFASGSHQFAWGLDDFSDVPGQTRAFVNPKLQQFMRNALDAMTR